MLKTEKYFTLIELPALSAARERARSANCISKPKQIGLAVFMYSGVNKDYTPCAPNSMGGIGIDYVAKAEPTDAEMCSTNLLMNSGYLGSAAPANETSAISQAEKAFRCPSDTANGAFKTGGSNVKSTSYIYCMTDKSDPMASYFGITTTEQNRKIVGRDRPDNAIWIDMIDITLPTGTKVSDNHPKNVNVCALGGHVKSMVAGSNPPANVTALLNFVDENL